MKKATFRVGSNIAFIKYWGVADPALNLPMNNSISMTLADAYTKTTVAWDVTNRMTEDEFTIDDYGDRGRTFTGAGAQRLVRHLDRLRALAGVEYRAKVVSQNNFPMASGIASSASGFAALTVAGCCALGLNLASSELSALARLGSGSASRSLFGGFVEWERGHDHASSIAQQLYPPDYWDLYDIVAVVSSVAKHTSSENGHTLAGTSPLQSGRLASLETGLPVVRQALADRDLARLGPILEQDALAMHAVMMTSTPSLLYWQPGTLEILQAVRQWRAEGLTVYFTIDAGPNVHLICDAQTVADVQKRLQKLSGVQSVIVSKPGPGPQALATHLF